MQNFVKIVALTALFSLVLGKPGYGPGEQDWDWIKVRTGSYMFYWLYYTTAKVSSFYDRPLVIWLQGGPGASSAGYGNFAEIGPLQVNGSERQYAWTKQVNVLFIDNPVGSGFSYVENVSQLTKDNIQIGKDMIAFLTEFYKKYPEFQRTPMHIFSESYGGKMAVEIGKQLDEKLKAGALKINFKGVVLIDSWISPIDSVLGWSPLLLKTGLIDQRSHKRLTQTANKIQKAIDEGKFAAATDMWSNLEWDILKETGGVDFYNILYPVSPGSALRLSPTDGVYRTPVELDELHDISKLMNGPVREALKIPKNIVHGSQSTIVFQMLSTDFMKPVMHVVEHLLNNTSMDVVVMSGQLDLIVDTFGTLKWVDNLRWKGSSSWASAKRTPLVVNQVIEGYVTKANTLSFYWVNRAGHMIPKDSPVVSMEILRRLTKFDAK